MHTIDWFIDFKQKLSQKFLKLIRGIAGEIPLKKISNPSRPGFTINRFALLHTQHSAIMDQN